MTSALGTLTDRIRAEFTEVPALKVTFEQACLLWNANEAQCRAALAVLISEGFLRESPSGAFIALPRPGGRCLKVPPRPAPIAVRCPHCRHMNVIDVDGGFRTRFTTSRCEACTRLVTLGRRAAE